MLYQVGSKPLQRNSEYGFWSNQRYGHRLWMRELAQGEGKAKPLLSRGKSRFSKTSCNGPTPKVEM
jgi:hypothetical protein